MKLKRFLCLLMVTVTLLSIMSIGASAASICVRATYNSLDEVAENLTVFTTIAEGKISAVKIKNVWYYQFSKAGSIIQIKASAFMQRPKNTNLEKDIKALNSGLAKDPTENYGRICYYNSMSSSSKTAKDTKFTSYKTSMYRFELDALGGHDSLKVKCKLTHFVTFTYNTKVLEGTYKPAFAKKYVSPSKSTEYVAALKREKTVKAITPVMSIAVANTGSNRINLSEYTVAGKGNAQFDKSVVDYAYTLTKLGKNVATSLFSENPVKIAGSSVKFLKEAIDKPEKISKNCYTGEAKVLSKNGNYVYKAKFVSCANLSLKGDWSQVLIECNDEIKNAKLTVNFSFK